MKPRHFVFRQKVPRFCTSQKGHQCKKQKTPVICQKRGSCTLSFRCFDSDDKTLRCEQGLLKLMGFVLLGVFRGLQQKNAPKRLRCEQSLIDTSEFSSEFFIKAKNPLRAALRLGEMWCTACKCTAKQHVDMRRKQTDYLVRGCSFNVQSADRWWSEGNHCMLITVIEDKVMSTGLTVMPGRQCKSQNWMGRNIDTLAGKKQLLICV